MNERDQAEIERSASEALKVELKDVRTERYMQPPADTAYPLEYAFHLLGDVRGQKVLDLGCGSGENIIPLLRRGADVIAIDISPELIAAATARVSMAGLQASIRVGSAYETGIAEGSIDIVFCMSLVHHLDIAVVREEIKRVLAPAGRLVLKEPVRFSQIYNRLRALLPSQEDVSEYEHPLTRSELALLSEGFDIEGMRYFRLPFVPFAERMLRIESSKVWRASNWALQRAKTLERYATSVVASLRKQTGRVN